MTTEDELDRHGDSTLDASGGPRGGYTLIALAEQNMEFARNCQKIQHNVYMQGVRMMQSTWRMNPLFAPYM